MTTGDEGKAALRRQMRGERARHVASLAPSIRAIALRVLPSPVLRRLDKGAVVALYWATGDEAPTAGIAAQLDEAGYRLALPRFSPDRADMEFAHWDRASAMQPGLFGTLQPGPEAPTVTPDAIVAPLVAFDAALARLGQGGGYYDRAFAAFPDALRIGLAWSAQIVDSVPVDKHDKPLDIVVTETAFYEREMER